MIHLILAFCCSALVSIIMRVSEKYVKNNISMLGLNYVMCIALAGYYTGYAKIFSPSAGAGLAWGLGIINGILYLAGFVLLQLNVEKNGVVLSATFMKLGVLVPAVVSILVFGEMPKTVQVIGFLLAIAAIVLINFEKEQTGASFKAGLIFLLLAGGGGDAMSKVYEELGRAESEDKFLFCTFAVALILCVALAIYKKQKLDKKDIFFGLLIGVPNYYSARFLLKALSTVPAVVAYPTYSVAGILLVTAAGIFIFKEKISKKQVTAIVIILAALVLLNL